MTALGLSMTHSQADELPRVLQPAVRAVAEKDPWSFAFDALSPSRMAAPSSP